MGGEKDTLFCSCGRKTKKIRETVKIAGIDCGILDINKCIKCGEKYLPDTSLEDVKSKLKEANVLEKTRDIFNF